MYCKMITTISIKCPDTHSSPPWQLDVGLCMHAKLLQSCLTLCDPMDCSPPGSSVHGILQARIWERVAMPSSSDLPIPGLLGFLSFQPTDLLYIGISFHCIYCHLIVYRTITCILNSWFHSIWSDIKYCLFWHVLFKTCHWFEVGL